MKYEAHITVIAYDNHSVITIREMAHKEYYWSFSYINGDPDLGAGVRCYLTKHSNNYRRLHTEMMQTKDSLKARDYKVVRMKIEQIKYDMRLT